MSNGYFLADTNSLIYAYRTGGPDLLDRYTNLATEGDRQFAITETVRQEIRDGPLKAELGQYIADRDIPVLSAPETEQRLRAGTLSSKSAGEVSMLEVAAREQEAGRITRVWSDDKYFDSSQVGDGLRCIALLHGVFLDKLRWQRARHTLLIGRLESSRKGGWKMDFFFPAAMRLIRKRFSGRKACQSLAAHSGQTLGSISLRTPSKDHRCHSSMNGFPPRTSRDINYAKSTSTMS